MGGEVFALMTLTLVLRITGTGYCMIHTAYCMMITLHHGVMLARKITLELLPGTPGVRA